MTMEYLEGQPLSKIRHAARPMDPLVSARIVSDALSGLHCAHQLRDFDGTPLDVVHRDLSPTNIFVTYDGVVKLVDFGIAKTGFASRAMTEIGILKGKLGYMAPEHVSRDRVDRRADIFALGVVLWELLTHRRLVVEKSPVAALKFVMYGTIPTPSTVNPGVDPELDRIVARALERKVEARYATALEMRNDLEAFLASKGRLVGEEELAHFMSDTFGDARGERESQIREWVIAADNDELLALSALPELDASIHESDRPSQPSPDPVAQGGRSASTSRGSLDPHAGERSAPAPAPVLGAAAVFVLGLICTTAYLLVARHPRFPSPAAPAAASIVEAPPTATAPRVSEVDPRPTSNEQAIPGERVESQDMVRPRATREETLRAPGIATEPARRPAREFKPRASVARPPPPRPRPSAGTAASSADGATPSSTPPPATAGGTR
jgi:serine/threonine-protein kinase